MINSSYATAYSVLRSPKGKGRKEYGAILIRNAINMIISNQIQEIDEERGK